MIGVGFSPGDGLGNRSRSLRNFAFQAVEKQFQATGKFWPGSVHHFISSRGASHDVSEYLRECRRQSDEAFFFIL